MQRKKTRKFNMVISLLLALILTVNCTSFRRDTHAFIAFAPIVIPVGTAVITITAEAVAVIAGILAAAGIIAQSVNDSQAFTMDFFDYEFAYNDAEDVLSDLKSAGFSVSGSIEDGNVQVSVPDYKAGTFVIDPDGVYKKLEWYKDAALSFGSDVISAGDRVIAGALTNAGGLTSIGSRLYDYLHNSTSVEIIQPSAPVVHGTLTDSSINSTVMELYATSCVSFFGSSYTVDDFVSEFVKSGVFNQLGSCSGYKYMDVYFNTSSYYNGYWDNCLDRALFVFYNTTYNEDYKAFNVGLNHSTYWTNSPYSGSVGGGILTLASDGLITNKMLGYCYLSDGSTSDLYLADFTQTATYTNIDYAPDVVDTPLPSTVPKVKVGDNIYDLAEGGNIYDDVGCIQDQAISSANENGDVFVAVPAVDAGGNIIPEADVATNAQAITSTVLNPDIELNNSPPDVVMESDNILTLIKDFFQNFFNRLISAIKSLFVISDSFLPDWFERFEAVFVSKGYDFDFDYFTKAKETKIPDFYITFRGVQVILIKSEYIYSCSEFVRPFIRAYIYFIILMHDRKRLIYLIRGTVPPDSELDTESKKG